jgi:DNA modification methylase
MVLMVNASYSSAISILGLHVRTLLTILSSDPEPGWSMSKNALYYGDNLTVLPKHLRDRTVDLVYLDPPFKSDSDYNILFQSDDLKPDEAQWTAFKDTWLWDKAAEDALAGIQDLPSPSLVNLVNALHGALGTSPMMAYLVNMAIRLQEIYRVLKPTGSLYLHCDPVASHYLKTILDAVFGPVRFRNEIIWRRTGSHNKAKRWAPIHDVILYYTKSEKFTWNSPRRSYMLGHVKEHFKEDGNGGYRTNYYGNVLTGSGTRNGESGAVWKGFDPTAKGRHWAIPGAIWDEVGIDPAGMTQHQKLDLLYDQGFITITPGEAWPMYEMAIRPGAGPSAPDIWSFQPYTSGTVFGSKDGIDEDVRWLSPRDQERLGYPTQKPIGLLKRIIETSSNEGDVVLDPFAGCGTTIEAAERLKRKWIGIDISPFAIQLVRKRRIEGAFPDLKLGSDYIIDGLPTTLDGAKLLAEQDKKAFEIWAVSTIGAIPNEKKGADRGIDGRLPFKPEGPTKRTRYAMVSVKAGKLKADDIRSLVSVAAREKTTSLGFGVMIVLSAPTKGMRADAAAAGMIEVAGNRYQAVQIMTVEEILAGKLPKLPLLEVGATYGKAAVVTEGRQEALDL